MIVQKVSEPDPCMFTGPWSRWCGGDADRNVVAHSGVNGQVQAQFGDPAFERMPGAVWVGAPQGGSSASIEHQVSPPV